MCLLGTLEQFWTISRSFWTIFEQYFCLFREIYDEKRTRFFTFFVKFWTQRGHISTFFASNIGRDPPGTLRGLFGPFPSNFQTNNWQFQSIFLRDQNPSQIFRFWSQITQKVILSTFLSSQSISGPSPITLKQFQSIEFKF